jgi:hypothetical protein
MELWWFGRFRVSELRNPGNQLVGIGEKWRGLFVCRFFFFFGWRDSEYILKFRAEEAGK